MREFKFLSTKIPVFQFEVLNNIQFYPQTLVVQEHWSLQRTALVKEINAGIDEMCDRNGWKAYKHPEVYYNDKRELSFDVMEVPKSVHLSREFYRWDMVKNEPNAKLKKQTAALF